MKSKRTVIVLIAAAFLFSCQMSQKKKLTEDEGWLNGTVRPRQIAIDWIGEPLGQDEGWRWSDPKDRTNAVRIHRGRPDAVSPVDRETYIVVTVKGELLNASGKPIGEYLRD